MIETKKSNTNSDAESVVKIEEEGQQSDADNVVKIEEEGQQSDIDIKDDEQSSDVDIKDEEKQCSKSDASNNNKWFIIVSSFLTKQAEEKLGAMKGENALNILCGTDLDPVDTRGRNAKKEDGTFKNYIECNGDSLTFEYNKLRMLLKFTFHKDVDDITQEELHHAILKIAHEDLNNGLFNEIFIEENNIKKYGEIITDGSYFDNKTILSRQRVIVDGVRHVKYVVSCDYSAFKCKYEHNGTTKNRGILLIGNNNSKDNEIPNHDEQLQIGHLGVLNRYAFEDIISFSKTICDNEVILNSLSNEDKEKVKTIYKNAINIENIFKTITGEPGTRIIHNNKQTVYNLILDVISKIDNYKIDNYNSKVNQTFKQLIEECASWQKPTPEEICSIFYFAGNIYESLGKQKKADACRALAEYNKDRINTLIREKEREKNSRWGCIMKKRINEQIAYLKRMRARPLLYHSGVINEISQRTPDSFTVSPCNFVQPWDEQENLTRVKRDILFRTDVIDKNRKKDANSENAEVAGAEENNEHNGNASVNNGRHNEKLNNSYHSADRANNRNNFRPHENLNQSYRPANRVNDFNTN